MAAWDEARSDGEYGTSLVVYMAIFLLMMASVFSLLIVLCAFHSRKNEQKCQVREDTGEEYSEASFETKSDKALVSSVEKTAEGELIWQRTILMGERCRPPNFSGAILYDTNGNLLPQFPSRTPRNSFTYQLKVGIEERSIPPKSFRTYTDLYHIIEGSSEKSLMKKIDMLSAI